MLLPQATITRAETCKIVSKALYSLSEIGTTLDPVWEENYTELQLGTASSGELSAYGGMNYSVEIGQAGYYTVSTTAEKYALYDAGGTRMEPVDKKDGKDVYMVKSAQELRLYTAGESGAPVTTTVEHAPAGYIAPVEVVFDHGVDENGYGADGKKHFNIFDDSPEHLRECDLMDGSVPDGNLLQGTMLARFENLEPGVYTVCSSHCLSNDYLSSGFPDITTNVYYDAIFYNASHASNVKITRIGYAGTHQTETNAWNDFNNPDKRWNYTLNVGNPSWISDILSANYFPNGESTLMSQGGAWGSVEFEMEFEVLEGTVSFGTVAYHNKPSDSQFAAWNANGQLRAPFETLETVKGKGRTMPTITADFEYIIDDSVADGTLLPVEITNMFFDKRELDFFSTHNTPFSTHNRWNMVGTSTVPLEYEGNGIVNRNYSTGHPNGEAITNPNGGPWIFDAYHTVDIRGKNIPEGARTGAYAGRTNFVANERFDEEWVHNLVTVPHDDAWLLQNDYAAFTDRYNIFHEMETSADVTGRTQDNPSVNPGYGLFNQFKVKIHNAGEQDRTFSYLVQGQKYTVNWESVDIQTGERLSGYSDVDIDVISPEGTLEVIHVDVKAGHTVEFTINGTIICGVNPTYHHAFAIDIPDDKLITYTKDKNGNDLVTPQTLCSDPIMYNGSVNAILQSREVE